MTTCEGILYPRGIVVVEASRLEGYDNFYQSRIVGFRHYVVEASCLEGYDNSYLLVNVAT